MAAATWRTKGGIIMFHLAMPSRGAPAAAIRRATAAVFEAATLIGAARDVEVSTRAKGEAAHAWSDVTVGEHVARQLESYPDVTGLLVRCDLHCEDREG